jgi:predicted translin family RNA/ssDNA-binding protein
MTAREKLIEIYETLEDLPPFPEAVEADLTKAMDIIANIRDWIEEGELADV